MGNAYPNIVPYKAFETANDYIIHGIGIDGQYTCFCKCAEHSKLAGDTRFATNIKRFEARETQVPPLDSILHSDKTENCQMRFATASVPAGSVNDIARVLNEPHARYRVLQQRHKQDWV